MIEFFNNSVILASLDLYTFSWAVSKGNCLSVQTQNLHPKRSIVISNSKGKSVFLSSCAVADAEATGRAGDI